MNNQVPNWNGVGRKTSPFARVSWFWKGFLADEECRLPSQRTKFPADGKSAVLGFVLSVFSFLDSSGVLKAEPLFKPLYRAEGVLTRQLFISASNQVQAVTNLSQITAFSIMCDDRLRWKIETSTGFRIGKLPAVETKETVSYDGTNIYSTIRSTGAFDTSGEQPRVVEMPKDETPSQIATGPFPIDNESNIGLVWLAFAGGNYLRTDTNTQFFPNLVASKARKSINAWIADLFYDCIPSDNSRLLVRGTYTLNHDYL